MLIIPNRLGTLSTLVLLVAILLPALYFARSRAPWAPEPVSLQDLKVEDIPLGEIHFGERRSVTTTLSNESDKTLSLDAPIPSCGCISLDHEPIVLAPHASKTLRFDFTAPGAPEVISRKVLINSATDPTINWAITLSGLSTGTVWAKPPQLSLAVKDKTQTQGQVTLYLKPGIQVSNVSSDSGVVLPRLLDRVGDQQAISVALSADAEPKGESVVSVTSTPADKQDLKIKVNWAPFTTIGVVPQDLALRQDGERQDVIERSLVFRGLHGAKKEDITCTPLVDWVKVKDVSVKDRRARVEILCDTSHIAPMQRTDVIRFCIDKTDCKVVQAYVLP